MPKLARRRTDGFTLIELLVTVAIIALLLGVTLPALAAARRRSQAVKCSTQSQGITASVIAFAGENKGRLPANRARTSPAEYATWRWQFISAGYLPSAAVFTCPAHPGTPLNELGAADAGAVCTGDVPASYALNGHVVWRLNATQTGADRTDAAIARPSHTAVLVETRAQFPDMRVISELLTTADASGGHYGFWHTGRGSYAFMDGHADQFRLLETGSPDCRWHNGKDLTPDPYEQQDPRELGPHDHPDWKYLVAPVYLR